MRYWLAGLLFILSIIPQVLTLPLLGGVNLVFLVVLWLVLYAFVMFTRKPLPAVIALLAAIAMAVPPSPNYLFSTNTGSLHFQFIGWANVTNDLYGLVFFFVFYLILFELAVFLIRKSRKGTPP